VGLDRFHQVDHVPSVARALISDGVDLLMQSIPTGGLRMMLEAMASGTPHLRLNRKTEQSWRHNQLGTEGSLSWSNLEELTVLLNTQCSSRQLSKLGKAGRKVYLKNNHPKVFRQRFNRVVSLHKLPDESPIEMAGTSLLHARTEFAASELLNFIHARDRMEMLEHQLRDTILRIEMLESPNRPPQK